MIKEQVVRKMSFDEVFDSQKTFRILLDSMSRPGKIYRLDQHYFSYIPAGLNPFLLSIMKTLCDNNVSFSIDDVREDLVRYLEINTMAACTDHSMTDYAVFHGFPFNTDFLKVKRGTLEFPEKGATVFLVVERISSDLQSHRCDCRLKLTGPGVQGFVILKISGLDMRYIDEFLNANEIFPMGIDLMIIDHEGNIISIPRSNNVKVV